jgi:hypothetical protein
MRSQFFFCFFACEKPSWSELLHKSLYQHTQQPRKRKIAHNEQVLLQVGDFITVSPELLLGFVKLLIVRTNVWLYSSAETEADSDMQPIVSKSSPTCSNTNVVCSFFFLSAVYALE